MKSRTIQVYIKDYDRGELIEFQERCKSRRISLSERIIQLIKTDNKRARRYEDATGRSKKNSR
jgi:hypothetical protein